MGCTVNYVGHGITSYGDNESVVSKNFLEDLKTKVLACLRNTRNSPQDRELLLSEIFGSNDTRNRVQKNPLDFIQTISDEYEEYRDDAEFVKAFISTAPSNRPLTVVYSQAIGSKLKSNANFMGFAIDLYPELILDVDKSLRDCSNFMRERIQKNPSLLSNLGETLSCHPGFILEMITQYSVSPVDLPRATTSDPRTMGCLIKAHPNLRLQLDSTLREDERFMFILDHPAAEAG